MNRFLARSLRALAVAALGLVPALHAGAGDFPTRPIRLVVPYPPGGATDDVARLLANSMAQELGQPVVIDNRGGAGGMLGADAVARAEPDGYTVLYSASGVHIINPAIYDKLPYDPIKSWTTIGLAIAAPHAVVVPPASPFHSLQDLIDHARRNPGKLNYGTAGRGSSHHRVGETLKDAAHIDLVHVPYKGGGAALTDFFGGRIDVMFLYMGTALQYGNAGKLRVLAVGSPERVPSMPQVPTMAEVLGVPGLDTDSWTGLVAPANTPAAVVRRLNGALNAALGANRERLGHEGYVVLGGSPEPASRARSRPFSSG